MASPRPVPILRPTILKLPREVLDNIVISSSHTELKAISLVSSFFHPSAQRALFHTIPLTLHLRSFANLMSISLSPILQAYVKRIEYTGLAHTYWYHPGDESPVVTFSDWCARYSGQDFAALLAGQVDDIKSFDAERSELFSERQQMNFYGQEYLSFGENAYELLHDTLARLPRLREVCWACYHDDDEDVCDWSWNLLTKILELNALRGVKGLAITELDPDDYVIRIEALRSIFVGLEKLRSLTLEFYPREKAPLEFGETKTLIGGMGSLQTLTVKHECDPFEFDVGLRFSGFLGTGQHWPLLKDLSLEGVVVEYQEFVEMLSKHASSLRLLNLINIRLASLNRDSLSWMDLFIFLHERMALTQFSCAGRIEAISGSLEHVRSDLEDGEGDFWEVRVCSDLEEKHEDCLNEKIEKYVLHRGPFPFSKRVVESERSAGTWRYSPWVRRGEEEECAHWNEEAFEEAFEREW